MKRQAVHAMVSILSLFVCSDEIRVDVSELTEFRRFVVMRVEIIGPVDACGIRPHYVAGVGYVTLIPLPGIDGSEVGFRIRLQGGSKVTVQKVIATNRMFDPSMSLEVLLEGIQIPKDAPVRLDLFPGNKGEGAMQLDPMLYRTLRSASLGAIHNICRSVPGAASSAAQATLLRSRLSRAPRTSIFKSSTVRAPTPHWMAFACTDSKSRE